MRVRQLPTILRILSEAYPGKLKKGQYDTFVDGPAIKSRKTTKEMMRSEIIARFGVKPKTVLKKDSLALLMFALIVFGKQSFKAHPEVYKPFIVKN